MKFISQFPSSVSSLTFIYNAERPADDPRAADRLAAGAEFAAERNDLSSEVIAASMDIARAVNGLNVDATTGEFVLADPFTGRSEGTTVRVPLSRIPDAGTARQVVDRYIFLSNNGNLDIDGDQIYFMADVDNDDEAIITAERLQAILFDANTPGSIQAYQDFVKNPVSLGNIAPAEPAAPVVAAVVPPEPVVPEVGMTTGTPFKMPENPADALPPAVVRSEAEILQAMQDPKAPLSADELGFLEDFEIIERLIGYPAENAAIKDALLQKLEALNQGPITREDCDNLAHRAHYFMMSRNADFNLSEADLSTQILSMVRAEQGIEAVEGSRLDENQRAQAEVLLGAADAATFLENRPAHETAAETMNVLRILSILKAQAQSAQEELSRMETQLMALQSETITPQVFKESLNFESHNPMVEFMVRQRDLQKVQSKFETGYTAVLNQTQSVLDRDIVNLINEAQAADSGLAIATQALDDGIAAQEVSPEAQSKLARAKTFIDAFAAARPGQDELYQQAYQALNNNDLAETERLVEEILDVSVRHWWHNMWGSDNYQTGQTKEYTHVDPTSGAEYTMTEAETLKITGAGIMEDPSILAQALREIQAYDAAEGVMLQATQAEITSKDAELTPGESTVLNDFHSQLFTESGDFNYESAAATSAAQKVDAMLARLITRDENGNITGGADPIGGAALESQRDQLIVSAASSAVFEQTFNQYLAAHPDNVNQLSNLSSVYSDMTGIGGEWNNFSDENLSVARDVGLFVGGFFIPFGAITGMMAKIGKTVNVARRAAVARVSNVAGRVIQGPGDEIARAGVTAVTRPHLVGGVDALAANADDALRAAISGGDDAAAVASQIAAAGHRTPNTLLIQGLSNGDDLGRAVEIARAAGSSTDELLSAALNSGRSFDEVYAVAGSFDDLVRVAGSRLDEAVTYGLQHGVASIDDLFRTGVGSADDIAKAAKAAGWNADDALILAINNGSEAGRITQVANAVGSNIDDLAMQALLRGGQPGQALNGSRITELVQASGNNIDEFMRAAQARGATPQALSSLGRAVGYSDDVIARVLNVSDAPIAMQSAPRVLQTPLDEAAARLRTPQGQSAPSLVRTVPEGGLHRPVAGSLDDLAALGDDVTKAPINMVQARAYVDQFVDSASTLGRQLSDDLVNLSRSGADQLAAATARLRSTILSLPAERRAAMYAVGTTAVAAPLVPVITDTLNDLMVSDAAAEGLSTDRRAPSVLSPQIPTIDPAIITAPEVVPEPPTLAEQMEAIGNRDIRAKAEALKTILNERGDSYEPGQWREISNQIATLFDVNLVVTNEDGTPNTEATEANQIAFGNLIQARIRNVLNIEEGTNEDLEDGKIGRESMRYLDRALLSVSESEITDQAEALQNFEAQTGGWRANNRAMAELFGINFAEDATDTQLKVFGRSIQSFAGGNDGAIGSRTIARLQERIAALDTA